MPAKKTSLIIACTALIAILAFAGVLISGITGYTISKANFTAPQQSNGTVQPNNTLPEPNGTIKPVGELAEVSSIIDGDTIVISTGEKVRLIGINTPELDEKCSAEATAMTKDFVLGKQVTLEQDVEDRDQYGRLLRYVYVGNTFVNLELVKQGLAHKYEYGSNTRFSAMFSQAEEQARQANGCLWEPSPYSECFSIKFHPNAAGDDNYNLNDEYVTFSNGCTYSIDMTKWTIKDDTASHLYTIPPFTLQGGASFTLHSGRGVNSGSDLYWGRSAANAAAIWNNAGDTLYLRDADGDLVLSEGY